MKWKNFKMRTMKLMMGMANVDVDPGMAVNRKHLFKNDLRRVEAPSSSPPKRTKLEESEKLKENENSKDDEKENLPEK